MQKIAIIIPCYNEEKRLRKQLLMELLETTDIDIFLANDGSIDGTLQLIQEFSAENPERCFIHHYPVNQGKANTVYESVNKLISADYAYIGYFDADFSTPVPELRRMLIELATNRASFIFGSRVLLLNAKVERKWYRHIIGRVIVTMINLKFKLGIYDTQCGAKIFSTTSAKAAFNSKFHTSWLFDVEVFIRLRRHGMLTSGQEFPLRTWKDVEGSKLGFSTGFKILKELYSLHIQYR